MPISSLHSAVVAGAAGAGGSYQVDNSAMFNDGDSEHLARDGFGQSPTSSTVCTISVWVKRGTNFGSNQVIIYGGDPSGSTAESLRFGTGDQLQFNQASSDYDLKTTQLFRDTHAWYHIVAVLNTGAAESSRAALYVNGSQVTDFATENYPGSSYSTNFTANSSSVEHVIGANASGGGASQFFDGYIAELYFIDGQALTPTSFGEFDTNGIWRPIDATGLTFGNNGFYLDFETSGSDLGDDKSGNSNDLTNTNSATQTSDSPTKNYAVLSHLTHQTNGSLSKGNTQTTASSDQGLSFSTFPVTTGQKVYIEALCSGATTTMTGCVKATSAVVGNPASDFDALESADGGAGRLLHVATGDVFNSDGNTSASNYAPNDSVPVRHMIALDLVNDKIYWGDAGVGASGWSNGSGSFNQAFGSAVGVDLTANLDWFFAFRPFTGTIEVNFGATAFTVDPPTGYSSGYSAAIENENRETALTIEDGTAYFQSTLYTGNASSKEVNQSGNSTFQPDFVWIKDRSSSAHHAMLDAVRGGNKGVRSSLNFVEYTESNLSFDADGFSMTSAGSAATINTSSNNYVAWQWNGGGSTVSNGDGSLASNVRANQTAGFSIVSYTGNGGSGGSQTVGHGLGAKPNMILIKNLSTTDNWVVYHDDIGFNAGTLNSTAARITTGASVYWNDTAHTSTIFNVNTHAGVNGDGNSMIAYCFTSIPGFSKFGGYVGNNNANGTFIPLGFKPAWVMVKTIATTGAWGIYDNLREPNNAVIKRLFANDGAAEDSDGEQMDFLSNGFKLRKSGGHNNSGATYLYMAFAEHPFAGTTPVTAR